MKQSFYISSEVKEAIDNNRPVVALESTIISHGMPYPQNVETALAVENYARSNGCVPATVAIIDGVLTVGCTKEQIELLGKLGTSVTKTSRRDLPIVIAEGKNGATTVAGTMYACKLAGIDIFATGGIGGAHRHSEITMDISADLDELQQTDVTVVCAGAKSILDIGLTLECLETRGVPVIGYRTEDMPAFYTQKSGYKVDYRLDTPEQIAKAIWAKKQLGLSGGMIVANAIADEYALDEDFVNGAIQTALERADELGIKGKKITPFLLNEVQLMTGGASLKANIQLVMGNVRLACEIARALCKLRGQQ